MATDAYWARQPGQKGQGKRSSRGGVPDQTAPGTASRLNGWPAGSYGWTAIGGLQGSQAEPTTFIFPMRWLGVETQLPRQPYSSLCLSGAPIFAPGTSLTGGLEADASLRVQIRWSPHLVV